MNKIHKWITSILLACILLLPFTYHTKIHAQDVDFDISHIDIRADIEANGDVRFTDTYTYDVDYFNGAEISIDHDEYNISDYRVGVEDTNTGQIEYYTESYNGSPGTYSIEQEGNIMTFRIYRPTSDSEINIIMEYTLEGLITNYEDTAQLNRKVVGNNVNERVDVTGHIALPGEVEDPTDFRVWAHGSPTGFVEPVTEGGESYITFEVPNNPSGQFVEIHSIFPTYLTPNNRNVDNRPMKDEIIQTENATVEADKKAYEAAVKRNAWLVDGLLGLNIVAFLWAAFYALTSRKRANPNPAHVPEHIYELPEELTPAIMATSVYRATPSADDFSATILDLTRKGFLEIDEIKTEKRGLFKFGEESTLEVSPGKKFNQRNEMLPHEVAVIDYLLPEGKPTTLYDIEQNIKKDSAVRQRKNALWEKFSDNAEVTGLKNKGTPPKERLRVMLWSTLLSMIGLGSFVGGIALLINNPEGATNKLFILIILGMGMFVAGIVLAVIRSLRPPLNYEQDKMKKEWDGFKNMLNDVGNMNMREVASLPLWGEYLAYAVSLGVGEKVLKAMNEQYGLEELQQSAVPMALYSNPSMLSRGLGDPVSRGLQNAVPQSSHSGSNLGGYGGGFSSGSSGGSGGGGGAGGF